MKTILHVTPHMGGGVGSAISNLVCGFAKEIESYNHTILLLEEPIRKSSLDLCIAQGINIEFYSEVENLNTFVEQFDMVVFNWWHHPLMYKFMNEIRDAKVRSILWVHISGNGYPQITESLIESFDEIFFTSEMTIEVLNGVDGIVNNRTKKHEISLDNRLHGLGDFSKLLLLESQLHEEFKIGYIGTLHYAKMHPEYAMFCKAVNVPNVKFCFAGEPGSIDVIQEDFKRIGLANKFEYAGYYNEVGDFFSNIDVLGYLLNPTHYGTTENVIIEAMAAGVPIVAMNQSVERHILKHMETGILVNSVEEYAEAIKLLWENPDLRAVLIDNARKHVNNQYSIHRNIERLHQVCETMSSVEKKQTQWEDKLGSKPVSWFLSGIGLSQDVMNSMFEDPKLPRIIETQLIKLNYPEILLGSTKGSIEHFVSYFHDEMLERCKLLIEELYKLKRN